MTDPKKEKRQFFVILTIVFLGFLGISIPYLIFPALFLNPQYSILPADWSGSSHALFLGITLAAYPFGQFIGSPILGTLSDEYGRKWLLSGSLLVAGFCNFLTGFAIHEHYLSLLILSRFAAGVMEGNIAIARAMATDLKSISKHESLGKINAISSISFLIGPLLGGALTDKNLFKDFTTATPFYFISLFFLCLTLLSALILDKSLDNATPTSQTFWQKVNLFKRMKNLFVNKKLRFLMITSTLFTLAVDIFYEFGPVYLTLKWTLNPSDLILYNGILCLTLAIGSGVLPPFFKDSTSRKWLIISSMALFSLLLIGLVFTDSPSLILLIFGISGIAIGLVTTLFTVKISNTVSEKIQGEAMGTQISLRVLGDAFICLFGGFLLLLSSKIILAIAAFISLLALIYYSKRNLEPKV